MHQPNFGLRETKTLPILANHSEVFPGLRCLGFLEKVPWIMPSPLRSLAVADIHSAAKGVPDVWDGL